MEFFTKIVNNFYLPIILAKGSLLDIWQGSKYISERPSKDFWGIIEWWELEFGPKILFL